MEKQAIDVSIIFVNYKTKELTINAVKSVIEKTEGLEYEIFAVDNASNDGSIEAIEKEFPNVNIIKNPVNSGFGAANNLAIEKAHGKYIFCLNTDTLLINNAVKILFDFMEQHPNTGAAGGYLFDKDSNPAVSGGHFPSLTDVFWKLGLRNIFKKYYRKNLCIDMKSSEAEEYNTIEYITGADIFLRKSALDKTGLFDERFFMYYEETDLCRRLKSAGYDISFVKEAKISHLENQSIDTELRHKKLVKTSEMIYFKKHHPNQVFIIKIIYIILFALDRLILGNKDSRELIKIIFSA